MPRHSYDKTARNPWGQRQCPWPEKGSFQPCPHLSKFSVLQWSELLWILAGAAHLQQLPEAVCRLPCWPKLSSCQVMGEATPVSTPNLAPAMAAAPSHPSGALQNNQVTTTRVRRHLTTCMEIPSAAGSKYHMLASCAGAPSTPGLSPGRARWPQQGKATCTEICCLVLLCFVTLGSRQSPGCYQVQSGFRFYS